MTQRWSAFLRGCLVVAALMLGSCGGGSVDGGGMGGGGIGGESGGTAVDVGGGSAGGVGSGGTGIAGGDGVGSGGTGITPVASVGSVEGFGSIIVNGIRYDISTARLLLSDASDLKLGMTVRVAGTVDASLAQGTATLVVSAADLRGSVASLDTAGGSFDVLSVHVTTDAATVFAGGLVSAADLANGVPVQVYGLPGAGAQLRATRIERLAAVQDLVASGPVSALDARAMTFRIGSLTVRYSGATFPADWNSSNLAGSPVVRVHGNLSAGVLVATSVEPWAPVTPPEGQQLSLAGLVSDFLDVRTLRIDGVPADLSQAQVSGGPLAKLGNGARVEATGTVRGGVLAVARLKIRDSADAAPMPVSYTARGNVGAFRSPASFKVQGQDIDASRATFVNGTAQQLSNNSRVLVTGSKVADDVLIADQVEFLP